MAKTSAPIKVITHYPTTKAGSLELAERVTGAHADMVNRYIRKLNCPSNQKEQMLDDIIKLIYDKNSSCKNRNCFD